MSLYKICVQYMIDSKCCLYVFVWSCIVSPLKYNVLCPHNHNGLRVLFVDTTCSIPTSKTIVSIQFTILYAHVVFGAHKIIKENGFVISNSWSVK